MRSTENIEKLVKNLDLGIDTNAQADQKILAELLDTQKQSMKQQSASILPNIRRFIMKSPITKLAVAVIIIAVIIGVNPFGNSKANVLWADIAKSFESVPFFHLTMYFGYDTSAKSEKIEIWKSEDSRVRAHDEDTVIFADYSKKEGKLITFDRITKEPKKNDGMAPMFLTILCKDGRFSLETLINSLPPEIKGITPVETFETAASKETVLFEAKHETTPERLTILALRESKLPIRLCYSDPRNNECGDFLFDYSDQKDAAFFDPEAFINETQKQSAEQHSENAFNEQEVIDAFRGWTVLSGGTFPSSLELHAIKDIDPNVDTSFLYNGENTQNGAIHFETPYATLDRDNPPPQEEIEKYFENVLFVLRGRVQEVLAEMTDWHYAGQGVKLGDADTAILWYCPKGSEMYRVIYGDLRVKNVKPENLPK